MVVPLRSLQNCLEGLMPSTIATCAADGTPNVTYLSHVHFVDDEHVALTFQFLNKTRKNVAENPRAAAMLVDSTTCRQYALDLAYERTETAGPLFERVRVKLEAIASLTGMTGVFRLQGVDIYRVLGCEPIDSGYVTEAQTGGLAANALALLTAEIAACEELGMLLDIALSGLARYLGYEHSMLLMADPGAARLYAVASHGYRNSGAGAEVGMGEGVIGVAAAERQPIRITHMGREFAYERAVRQRLAQTGGDSGEPREIQLPGLVDVQSQIAIPVSAQNRLIGVLYLESPQTGRFLEKDEAALVSIANHLGTAILLCSQHAGSAHAASERGPRAAPLEGRPLQVRRFEYDQSIFLGEDYLIKGVAGAILWKMLCDHAAEGRIHFSNRELRSDPAIGLPDIADNLEARLVLLMRRLKDRSTDIRLEKIGRGRVRLSVLRPLELRSVKPA
jgi:adenylate cyclase